MDKEEIKEYLKNYCEKWLNEQKDTLMLQLVGFIMDHKYKLENEIGSGEVQKLFNEDTDDNEKVVDNEIIAK